MKVIYIASPFSVINTTNLSPAEIKAKEKLRYEQITKVTARLLDYYKIAPILPITMSYQIKKYNKKLLGTFEQWKEIDLAYIAKCEEVWVVMMEGWKESVGVTAEIEYAKSLDIPVMYVCPETLFMVPITSDYMTQEMSQARRKNNPVLS